MQLEVGKSYVNRLGEIVHIVKYSDTCALGNLTVYNYCDSEERTYMRDGRFNNGLQDSRDLIEEVLSIPEEKLPSRGRRAKTEFDEINKASHYNQGKFEVIDVVEDWKLEAHEMTAVIYIARAMHKGARIKDLKKSVWWLNRKIEMLESAK